MKQHSSQYDGYVLVPVDNSTVNLVDKIDGMFEVDLTNAMILNRTSQQRKAIEVYCRELATACNNAGLDMHTILAHRSIPWSQHTIKEEVWKKIQMAKLGIKSTTQLGPAQVSEVYDVVNNHFSSKFGLYVPFHNKDK